MKKLVIFFFLFFGTFAFLQAQKGADLSGLWLGKITQDEGGYASDYVFEIYIRQDGSKISGRSYVYVDNIYASFDISGSLHSEVYMDLKDSEILESKVNEGMEWCLKKYQLVFKIKNGVYHLEGFWQGETSFSTCIPGKIFLKKQVPRA